MVSVAVLHVLLYYCNYGVLAQQVPSRTSHGDGLTDQYIPRFTVIVVTWRAQHIHILYPLTMKTRAIAAF